MRMALGWWAANKIAGIPEIRCGLRDDHRRTIERIETIKTDRLATSRYTEVICIDIIISFAIAKRFESRVCVVPFVYNHMSADECIAFQYLLYSARFRFLWFQSNMTYVQHNVLEYN